MVWNCLTDNSLFRSVLRKPRSSDELVAAASCASVPGHATVVCDALPRRGFIFYELMRRALFGPVKHHQFGQKVSSHEFAFLIGLCSLRCFCCKSSVSPCNAYCMHEVYIVQVLLKLSEHGEAGRAKHTSPLAFPSGCRLQLNTILYRLPRCLGIRW